MILRRDLRQSASGGKRNRLYMAANQSLYSVFVGRAALCRRGQGLGKPTGRRNRLPHQSESSTYRAAARRHLVGVGEWHQREFPWSQARETASGPTGGVELASATFSATGGIDCGFSSPRQPAPAGRWTAAESDSSSPGRTRTVTHFDGDGVAGFPSAVDVRNAPDRPSACLAIVAVNWVHRNTSEGKRFAWDRVS